MAAEKVDCCLLFDADGTVEDTVWSEPARRHDHGCRCRQRRPVSGHPQVLLSNDSKEAKIVIATPKGKGTGRSARWWICPLCTALISCSGEACVTGSPALWKSGHEHKGRLEPSGQGVCRGAPRGSEQV